MRQLSDITQGKDPEREQMYRDVTRYFGFYLGETIQQKLKQKDLTSLLSMTPKQVANYINDIIGDALITSYKKVKDFVNRKNKGIRGKFGKDSQTRKNEYERKAITDMIKIIEKLKKQKAFGKYGYMFDLDVNDINTIWDRRVNSIPVLKNTNYDRATVDSKYAGNALELITTVAAAEIGNLNVHKSSGDLSLNIVGEHTGQKNQMKADTLLFVSTGNINTGDYLQFVDSQRFPNAIRQQNIDAMEKYLNSLEENIKHVIAISDKNYSITAGFDGIEAQSKMNLQNVGAMLSQFGVGQVTALIDYLANCGPSMVQGDVDGSVRTTLQSYIAYFLFDHLEVNINGPKPSANTVNLLNVSGIYMPLSVYLEGLRDSIVQATASPSSLVSVSISLGGPTAERVWTAATWDKFREQHETQSYIEYKILRNLANFISGLA
jgi:predicted RNase H-related nuclease YkuK (DUF458 family)